MRQRKGAKQSEGFKERKWNEALKKRIYKKESRKGKKKKRIWREKEEDWKNVWFQSEAQWKNFTRGTDCLSRTSLFQCHQRRQYLPMLRFLSLYSPFLSTSILFLSKRPLKWLTFKGDLTVDFLFYYFCSHKTSFAISHQQYPATSVVTLHWSGTKINLLISFNESTPKGGHIISFKTSTRYDFSPQTKSWRCVFGSKWRGDGGVFHKAHHSMSNEQLSSKRKTGLNVEIIR